MSKLFPCSILVVEDEPEFVSLFKNFLTKEGYDVVSFTDPVLALAYLEKTGDEHSLIIVDLKMPGISGIDVAKSIIQKNNNVKIFLLTAFGAVDLKYNEDFKKAKIDRLIQKPIHFSDLRLSINESLKD